jgi:hypothetical protein
MEDAEAKRLAKQTAEKAAANKFAADKCTSLDQLSAMEGKYGKHLYDNKTRRSSNTSTHKFARMRENCLIPIVSTRRNYSLTKSTTGRRSRISRLNLWGVPVFP